MRVTDRDLRLVKDICLSHVLSRDQIIQLGYFTSVGRTNTRLRELVNAKCVRVADTPFFSQNLYFSGPIANQIVGERIAAIISSRKGTPRFIQHALALTDIRIGYATQGAHRWRFEQQIKDAFNHGSRKFEFKPDGCFISPDKVTFVEADLGHANQRKLREKLASYSHYQRSGRFRSIYGDLKMQTLFVTTGHMRKRHLVSMARDYPDILVQIVIFKELGIRVPGGWS